MEHCETSIRPGGSSQLVGPPRNSSTGFTSRAADANDTNRTVEACAIDGVLHRSSTRPDRWARSDRHGNQRRIRPRNPRRFVTVRGLAARIRHLCDRIPIVATPDQRRGDRKSVVWGKSVSERVALGGRRIIKKKKKTKIQT